MLKFRPPTEDVIGRFLASQRSSPLTYATEGMTRHGVAPADFHCDHLRVQIGEGPAVFERAVAALQSWTMFRQGWVELHSDGPPTVGQVVAIVPRIGPVWWLNACRVLYLIDEHAPTRRVGFGYGTLADHAECGEERFCVEMMPDGAVWYDLFAYSRPQHWLARVGKPFTRTQQRRFARGSAAAMRRAVVPELPQDYWHTFVYVHFGWLCCGQCEIKPDLEWAWDGIEVEGEPAAEIFAIRAVEHLKAKGWVMHEDQPCCPACAIKLGIMP